MSAESRITVGLLHPGEMGAAVGTTVVAGGMPCLWASAARSAATRARAREVGLEDAGTLEAVVRASRVILSVVPPHGAADLARAVAALGFRGLYVDANAVAPATARDLGRVVEAAGALLAEWKISKPDLPASSERAIHDNARKAWRFVGEMDEIARSLAAVGLPPAFHEAAREIFARLAGYKDTTTSPTVEEAAAKLLGQPRPSTGRRGV